MRVDENVTAAFEISDEKLETMIISVRESFDRVDQFMTMG